MTTLGRRWKFVLALFLAGVVGAFAVSLAVTPMYEATVRVYFSASGNGVLDQVQMGTYTQQRAKSYAALAEDPTVLQGVIDKTRVDTTPEELAGRVQLEVIQDTVVLKLSVQDPDAQVARKLADAYTTAIATTVQKAESVSVAGGQAQSAVTARPQGPASVSSGPVSPDFPLNVAVGALLGLLFGVGGAVLREILSQEKVPTQRLRPTPHARDSDLFAERVH